MHDVPLGAMRLGARFAGGPRLSGRTFGDRVRRARTLAGLTQAEVAEMVDSHRPLVSRVERDLHSPLVPTAELYAAVLGVELVDLVGRRW